uniref:RBR-type E3 ubiquitin transferase n=1 Tax=Macrostomum lignano TaxID=282301 RepID=A0A1I8HP02_9PLAT
MAHVIYRPVWPRVLIKRMRKSQSDSIALSDWTTEYLWRPELLGLSQGRSSLRGYAASQSACSTAASSNCASRNGRILSRVRVGLLLLMMLRMIITFFAVQEPVQVRNCTPVSSPTILITTTIIISIIGAGVAKQEDCTPLLLLLHFLLLLCFRLTIEVLEESGVQLIQLEVRGATSISSIKQGSSDITVEPVVFPRKFLRQSPHFPYYSISIPLLNAVATKYGHEFGEIQVNEKGKFLIAESPVVAQKLVEKLNASEVAYLAQIKPHSYSNSTDRQQTCDLNELKLRLTFPRRYPTGFANVSFDNPEDASSVLERVTSLSLNNSFWASKMALDKRDPEKLIIFDVPLWIDEDVIANELARSAVLLDSMNPRVTMRREHQDNALSKEAAGARVLEILRAVFSSEFVDDEENYQFGIRDPPNSGFFDWQVTICFRYDDDYIVFAREFKQLKGFALANLSNWSHGYPVRGRERKSIFLAKQNAYKASAFAGSKFELIFPPLIVSSEIFSASEPLLLEVKRDIEVRSSLFPTAIQNMLRVNPVRRECLSIYGTDSVKSRCQIIINNYLSEREALSLRELSLAGAHRPRSLIRRLLKTFGRDLSKLGDESVTAELDLGDSRTLTLFGVNADAVAAAAEAVERLAEEEAAAAAAAAALNATTVAVPGTVKLECPVCFAPAGTEAATTLALCGHVYCTDCLDLQLASTTDVPLLCAAEGCGRPFHVAQDILDRAPSPAEREQLMRRLLGPALKSHVNLPASCLQFCPAPDCPGLLRDFKEAAVRESRCKVCRGTFCLDCQYFSHVGLTCETAKEIRANPDYGLQVCSDWLQQLLLVACLAFEAFRVVHRICKQNTSSYYRFRKPDFPQTWLTADSRNRKQCPRCRVHIEKNAGCNHMTCTRCHCHFCWLCVRAFDSAEEVEKLGSSLEKSWRCPTLLCFETDFSVSDSEPAAMARLFRAALRKGQWNRTLGYTSLVGRPHPLLSSCLSACLLLAAIALAVLQPGAAPPGGLS